MGVEYNNFLVVLHSELSKCYFLFVEKKHLKNSFIIYCTKAKKVNETN